MSVASYGPALAGAAAFGFLAYRLGELSVTSERHEARRDTEHTWQPADHRTHHMTEASKMGEMTTIGPFGLPKTTTQTKVGRITEYLPAKGGRDALFNTRVF